MRVRRLSLLFLCFVAVTEGFGQNIQINRDNRTIAISADARVTAEPDIAVLRFGVENYGRTSDEVFATNKRIAQSVVARLSELGIPDKQIQTVALSVKRVDEPEEHWTEEERRLRKFDARQGWTVRLKAVDAQPVLDAVMEAGANYSSEPDWEVSDKSGLQAKAGATALEKARTIADSLAKGLGVKVTGLVYASNKAPALLDIIEGRTFSYALSTMSSVVTKNRGKVSLKLFPRLIEQDATVFAVFSIE